MSDSPETEDWPTDGVEWLGSCPICQNSARELMHSDLVDRLFDSPSGPWNFYACANCGSGYLDPRPTREMIHLAYRDYHTHTSPHPPRADELRGLRLLQRTFANGYKNWRYGTSLEPSSQFGLVVAWLLPHLRSVLDRQCRHLPRRPKGRLLDVGLGNGEFLEIARSAGWTVVGTDLDPLVVANARERGLDAFVGTVDCVKGPFDVITMSHVLEHLHDPVSVLRSCYALLRPGGIMWLETPNNRALGHRRFGKNWRGLEPPRHLVLFNHRSLREILHEVGFSNVRDLKIRSPVVGLYHMSAQIRDGHNAYLPSRVPLMLKLEAATAIVAECILKDRREFISVRAIKPYNTMSTK